MSNKPWPPRFWIYYFKDLLTGEFDIDAKIYRKFDGDKQYLSLEEHTHLLAEAVANAEREAKAYKESLLCILKVIDQIEEQYFGFEEKSHLEEMVIGIRHHIYGTWIEVDELRKGATPENGGKE